MITHFITVGQVLDAPGGRAVLEKYLPATVDRDDVRDILVLFFLRVTPGLRDDEAARTTFWEQIDAVMAPIILREHAGAITPSPVPSSPRASAPWTVVGEPTRWGILEIALDGPAGGNPFIDVELTAEFRCGEHTWTAGGFYDGDGTYRLRVLAEQEGTWQFVTTATTAALDGVRGEVVVGPAAPGAHGPVRSDGFHFAHADGTRYRPWGTTAYAWNHQDEQTQAQTLKSLADSSFTKLRMCLFPKHFVFNDEEPDRFPFPRAADGSFDHTRFDTGFFARLDDQVRRLGELGIQADIILFHPYDRWGFSDLGPAVDERVVRYVVRRLAGYAHVWFSLANEYDAVPGKTIADWDRIGEQVVAEDPHGHLVSIHNFIEHFDHTRPWITHASVQHGKVEEITGWREAWNKPVVIDEAGYEGDIEFDWGNLTGEEMLRRFWDGALRGGYVGHGETYWNPQEQLWWAKGGRMHGTSHQRIGFLEQIVADSPTGVLEPLPSDFDLPWAGVLDEYHVTYYGMARPRERHILLPPGRWHVDVLDTRECTVERLPGTFETIVAVPLPAEPYQAVRLVKA
ncbi:hypothetical protein ACTI_00070 [Actinoplanes sp. OR16]|uniref:DUF5605 domain-containing protein n=1 Tax=Actinoplanes sp. OR16 TaxID=946334 RepID=UPI000F6E3144|nr:DUF5605 domain-containing protein [Actinoplanes sp. OR16]BBH63322.1 hypothetical protein ACTI_00070 [Actinoplanes sp. OR16]